MLDDAAWDDAPDASAAEPVFAGVSLRLYASVQAALGAGFDLEQVLSHEQIALDAWLRADEIWAEKLLESADGDLQLAEEYDRELAVAQARFARRVEPLDADFVAWNNFVRHWSQSSDPDALVAAHGLDADDLLRLNEHWSGAMAADPTLQKQMTALLAAPAAPLPPIRVQPRVLPPPVNQSGAVLCEPEADAEQESDAAAGVAIPLQTLIVPLPEPPPDSAAKPASLTARANRKQPEAAPESNVLQNSSAHLPSIAPGSSVRPAPTPRASEEAPKPRLGSTLALSGAPDPYGFMALETPGAVKLKLSLAEFASACAELEVYSGQEQRIASKYFMTGPEFENERNAWRERLANSPDELADFNAKFDHYRKHWKMVALGTTLR